MKTMGVGEGVKVALFVMSLVFALLAAIYALIKLASAVIRRYFSKA
jgi:Na+-transporting methylmalonyl-CoA/oxaloacetate decarboxylase gamma subunit